MGIDGPSFDVVESHDYPVHKLFMSHGILLIENLTNLELLLNRDFLFSCYPLKIKEGDGSPVRAVGVVMSDE
jgi:kynurenine formamidase